MDGDARDLDHAAADDRVRPDPVRGRLHVFTDESLEEFCADLALDVVEGLELRLAFEAWADERR